MRVLILIVALAAVVGVAQAVRPMHKVLQPALLEKHNKVKAKALPHPTQYYRMPTKENKMTPGKACHDYSTCEECGALHICVWTKGRDGTGEGECLDERNPAAVYGTRESCPGAESNGYRDVRSKEEEHTEEVANMVGDADYKEDTLGGVRLVVHAVDVDTGDQMQTGNEEDKEDLTDTRPKWAKNSDTKVEEWKGYDGTKVTTKTIRVTTRKGGPPHEAPPASGTEGVAYMGETGQETPEEVIEAEGEEAGSEEGEEAAEEEAPAFRSSRKQDDDDIHAKYHALEGRVAELEAMLAHHHGEEEGGDNDSADEVPEDKPESPLVGDVLNIDDEPADDEDFDAPEESEPLPAEADESEDEDDLDGSDEPFAEDPLEYAHNMPEPVDNFDTFNDPAETGEHEAIVKETTITKISKNDKGEVIGQPEVTKQLEELAPGTTDPDP